MKKIKYEFLQFIDPTGVPVLSSVMLGYSESNLAIAEKEAYNGEYTVEDDGHPEPEKKETTDDVLNALLGVTE